MTVRVYRSTDGSAPVLTGQAGKLTDLLDAVLVNGYGAQTAAGWTTNQTTTNKRGYKQNTIGSNNSSGMLLYVDDTGPGAGGAKEARVCGFETMSAITPTGTGQFPTGAQSAVGSGQLAIRKSTTADATARAWTIVANGQTIYLFIETGDTTAPLAACPFVFGDFKSYKTSDQYAVIIIARPVENTGSSINDPLHVMCVPNNTATITPVNSSIFGHFVARHWTATGGSIRVGKPLPGGFAIASVVSRVMTGGYNTDSSTSVGVNDPQVLAMGRNSLPQQWPAPNGPDGAVALAPVYISHNFAVRGYLAGLWQPMQDRPLGHSDTFTVSGGNLNGKSLLAQNIQGYIGSSANGDNCQCIVETSDTWA